MLNEKIQDIIEAGILRIEYLFIDYEEKINKLFDDYEKQFKRL